jgi:hypothetical protein
MKQVKKYPESCSVKIQRNLTQWHLSAKEIPLKKKEKEKSLSLMEIDPWLSSQQPLTLW